MVATPVESNKCAVQFSENFEGVNLFPLNFHLLDHLCKAFSRFSDLDTLDTSGYEYVKFIINKFVNATSMKEATTIDKSFEAMNANPRSYGVFGGSLVLSCAAG